MRALTGCLMVLGLVWMTAGCGGGGGGGSTGSSGSTGSLLGGVPASAPGLAFGSPTGAARILATSEFIPPIVPFAFFQLASQAGAQAVVPAFTVTALDANGNVESGVSVTISLNDPNGGHLDGTTVAATTTDGTPMYQDIVIAKPGTYTITATANGFASATSNPITILNTAPSFGSPVSLTATPNPSLGVPVDLNQDGSQDVVLATTSGLTIFENDGTGNLTPVQSVALPSGGAPSVVVADLDGDGFPDIISGSTVLHNITVSKGAVPQFSVFATLPVSSIQAAGPLGTDVLPDLVSVSNNVVFVQFNQSTASALSFSAPIQVATLSDSPSGLASVHVADINGDSRPDIVIAFQDNLTVLEGTGMSSPAFTEQVVRAGFDVPIVDCELADLNGDHKLDVVTQSVNTTIQVLLNTSQNGILSFDGNGQFIPNDGEERPEGGAATGVHSLAVTDVDGDGRPDIVTTASDTGEVYIMLNQTPVNASAVTFAEPAGYSLGNNASGLFPQSVFVADMTGDKLADLLIVNSGTQQILILPGQ